MKCTQNTQGRTQNSHGAKFFFFFEHFQNKMFSNGIIHSITTNVKLRLCAAVRPKQCLPTPQNLTYVSNLFSNGQKGEKPLRKKIICRNQFVNTSQQNAAHRSEMQILAEKRSRLPLIKTKQFPPKSIVYTIQARLSTCIYSDTEKKPNEKKTKRAQFTTKR